jgi:hypothetical protein
MEHNCSKFTCREVQIQTTGVHAFNGVRPLILFPNPIPAEDAGFTLMGISGSDLGASGTLYVYTLQGACIAMAEVSCAEQIPVRLPGNIVGGMYVVELTTGHNIYSGKFIVR